MTFDFTNHTVQNYAIDGTAKSIETFTVSGTTMTFDSNGEIMHVNLMANDNGYFSFSQDYINSRNWGQGSATQDTMSDWLTAHNNYLWVDYGVPNGLITNTNGVYSLDSNDGDHATVEMISSTSLKLIWSESNYDTYTINTSTDTMEVTEVGTDIFSLATTNPFDVSYAYEFDMGNGIVAVGLHDAMVLNVADLSYNHTLYGIDAVQDTGVNAITITLADVLVQGLSDGNGHYNLGVNGGTNDTVSIGSGWTQNGTYADANSPVTYNVYTQDIAHLMISQGTQVI
jgi:hypothetical protein